jgi:GntR family transcriptional regulator
MPAELPTLTVDLSSSLPVYRQIVDSIRTLLVDAVLRPGDTLPPVREVALGLGVHFNTVAEAYRILADEGWLDLKRRRGALVVERSQPKPADAEKTVAFKRRVRELIAEVQSTGLSAKLVAQELRVIAEGLEK